MTTEPTPAPEPTPQNQDTPAPDPVALLTAKIDALTATVEKLTTAPARPAVPPTDSGKPAITPKAPDPYSLPPIARMAAGYTRK